MGLTNWEKKKKFGKRCKCGKFFYAQKFDKCFDCREQEAAANKTARVWLYPVPHSCYLNRRIYRMVAENGQAIF